MEPSSEGASRYRRPEDFLQSVSRSRLQALYSDFSRQKQSNPTSFHSNVDWWRGTLVAVVNSGETGSSSSKSRLCLRADRSLLETFKLEKIGKPLAMGTVVNELRSTKALIPLSEFMAARDSIYDPGWLPYRIASFVVGRPLWWALEQAGIVGDEGIFSSSAHQIDWFGEYVVMELLEQAADAIIVLQETRMTGPADTLFTREGFRKIFASIFNADQSLLSETDTQVILKYLERERKVLVIDNNVVKFVDGNGFPDERIITTVDRGILELKSAISNMQHLVEVLQVKLDEYTQKATAALRQNQKSMAFSYLRSRKQLKEVFNKRLASLGTLEDTMTSIETAMGDIQIMKNYEVSTLTLRAILSHPSLQSANMERTMDALAEATHAAQEVDSAIRIGGDVALGIESNEEEVEEEWNALVREIEADAVSVGELEPLRAPTTLPRTVEVTESKGVLIPSAR